MSIARDTQRQRVYTAESAVEKATPSARLEAVRDVERFVKATLARKRVQDDFPRATRVYKYVPDVTDGRGRRRACAVGSCEIRMPVWSRTELIVLHELAHIMINREHGDRDTIASHGWQFCAAYLRLVLHVMGRQHHDALKASFKAHRVRFTKPRAKRELTPEQRAALVARMAAARGVAVVQRTELIAQV